MRWKKWAIGVGTTVAVAVPASLLITVAATPRPPLASDRFLLNFVDQKTLDDVKKNPSLWASKTAQEKKLIASQNFVNESIQLVDMVLDEYAKQGKDPSWNLNFATLNASPTNDELNFFQELTRAILYISQGRIKFNLIPRTPSSVDQGFNKKDQQMVSWYWSPDYNGLGTWLGYNFAPDFIVPNMWPWLCAQLQDAQSKTTGTGTSTNETWQASLATYLGSVEVSTKYYAGKNDEGENIYKSTTFKIRQIVPALENNISDILSVANIHKQEFNSSSKMLVPNLTQMYEFVTKFKIAGTNGIYAAIQNAISAWSMVPTNNTLQGTFDSNGKLTGYQPSKVIQLINTLNYNPNMIPFIGDGPQSKNPKLVRFGANAPENPKSFFNTRDWFLQADASGNYSFTKDTFSWQAKADPFAQNITAWNSTFTENTSQLGKPTFVNLYSWTTVNNPTDKIIDTQLVAEGTSKNNKFSEEVDKVIAWVSAGGEIPKEPRQGTDVQISGQDGNGPEIWQIKSVNGSPENLVLVKVGEGTDIHYVPRWKFDFPIRPIQWVDSTGTPISDQYLSPRDFWAGWKGYKISCDGGLSHNAYFIDMLGVDMDTTLNYGEGQIDAGRYINTSTVKYQEESSWEKFSMFMNNPTLPGQTCEDILTNQYFGALPYSNEQVQNIIGKTSPSKIKYNGKKIDKNSTFANNQIYGSGLATESYKHLWYASPYMVKECTPTSFTLKLNEKYFDYFKNEASTQTTGLNPYLQFNINTKAPFGLNGTNVNIKKIPMINVSYVNYNIKTTFDQFKNGSRDMAEIPSNEMPSLGVVIDSLNNDDTNQNPLTKDIYSPLVAQENKTNLIPYNTNVYTTTTTKQGINVYQAQLSEQATNKNIDLTKWGVVPGQTDVYGNTIKWKAVPLDADNVNNGFIPELGDLKPILKEHIPTQYHDLIVKTYNSNAKMSDLIKVFITNKGNGQINGVNVNSTSDILNFSSTIIRNTINNAINWLDMADVCFPSNNKSPQLSFTPYGVFNTNPQNTDARWKYYNLAWEKPWDGNDWASIQSLDDGTNKIAERVGGILKFTRSDYVTASSNVLDNLPNIGKK